MAYVQKDWAQREFSDAIQHNILKIAEFLTNFDISIRFRLAKVNEKLHSLERQVDFLESSLKCVKGVGPFDNPTPVTARQSLFSNQQAVTGVKIETLQPGNGTRPSINRSCTIHYIGMFTNGSTFDSSRNGQPFQFTLGAGSVIRGWEEGIAQMTVGERAKITCPPDFAYGVDGFPPLSIPPNATLVFEIELLSVS